MPLKKKTKKKLQDFFKKFNNPDPDPSELGPPLKTERIQRKKLKSLLAPVKKKVKFSF